MLEIIAPGPLLTVQDLGRPTARRFGVPPGGAMDAFALIAANRLLGNPDHSAALEITAGGVDLAIMRAGRLALAGADLGASLDGRPLPLWTTLSVSPGQRLRLAGRRGAWGARAYLAVAGGLDLPVVLGSRATDLGGGFGGLAGRPLRPGDQLGALPASSPAPPLGQRWPEGRRPGYAATPTLRLLPGPHLGCLRPGALEALAAAELRVAALANRMGYRLDGARLPHARPASLPSLGVIPGTLQVPPDGGPILLMADAQTTGGYPVAAVLISADLPLAAQLLPGDRLRFAITTLAEAAAARRELAARLAAGPEPDDGGLLMALAGALE
jgi:biotin-dependent carboxylase-like uncharacterized protein